jgi:hypothetical protein
MDLSAGADQLRAQDARSPFDAALDREVLDDLALAIACSCSRRGASLPRALAFCEPSTEPFSALDCLSAHDASPMRERLPAGPWRQVSIAGLAYREAICQLTSQISEHSGGWDR